MNLTVNILQKFVLVVIEANMLVEKFVESITMLPYIVSGEQCMFRPVYMFSRCL